MYNTTQIANAIDITRNSLGQKFKLYNIKPDKVVSVKSTPHIKNNVYAGSTRYNNNLYGKDSLFEFLVYDYIYKEYHVNISNMLSDSMNSTTTHIVIFLSPYSNTENIAFAYMGIDVDKLLSETDSKYYSNGGSFDMLIINIHHCHEKLLQLVNKINM